MSPPSKLAALLEIAGVFLRLGCISFGGPVAHLGYFHEEVVRRRRWLGEEAYADLVALCQFLPGPASSQVVFALGMRRGGLAGALAASLGFMAPSVALMILFAYGVTAWGGLGQAGWLHGLKLAAVAVVAQAVWGMGLRLCPDRARLSVALAAAAAVLLLPGAGVQVGAIAAGALFGLWFYRGSASVSPPEEKAGGHGWAIVALVVFFALLLGLPFLAAADGFAVKAFDAFYRSGALVFGGGHVVLPLLREELVPRGWVGDHAFLAGYGAAQAIPGPLFTFAAYLGTVMTPGPRAWLGGLWCLLGIFLPAWLLLGGTLPFWHRLKGRAWARAALCGANAAVVGVLLAALYDPVWTQGVTNARDVAAVLAAFGLLQFWRVPPWLVVALAAAAGQWLL